MGRPIWRTVFEHINAHAVEGGTGHLLEAAVLALNGGALLAQAAVGQGHGEVIAVVEGFPLHRQRDLLGEILLLGMDDDTPAVAGEHLLHFSHGGIVRAGRAGVIFAPVGAAVHTFQQGAAVPADLGCVKEHGVCGAHFQRLVNVFLCVFCGFTSHRDRLRVNFCL